MSYLCLFDSAIARRNRADRNEALNRYRFHRLDGMWETSGRWIMANNNPWPYEGLGQCSFYAVIEAENAA